VAAAAIGAVRRERTAAKLGMASPLQNVRLTATAADLERLARVTPDVVAASNSAGLETQAASGEAEERFAAVIEKAG